MNNRPTPDRNAVPQLDAQQCAWLEWQLSFGVDAVVGETPCAYLAADAPIDVPAQQMAHDVAPESRLEPLSEIVSAPAPQAAQKPKTRFDANIRREAPVQKSSVPLSQARAEAESLASTANSLEELREKISAFEGCSLKATAGNLVFGVGVENPVVMLIGEGPGAEEDRRGVPFVGASGRLMQRTLETIGLNTRENLYISNTVYWRPPADRTPHETEIAACLPFLRRQITLVNPQLLVLVGARAAQTLLATSSGITRIRGGWTETAEGILQETLPALPVFHPAYLFRNHAQKRLFWHDMLRIRQQIDALSLSVPWKNAGLHGFSPEWRV